MGDLHADPPEPLETPRSTAAESNASGGFPDSHWETLKKFPQSDGDIGSFISDDRD